MRAMVGLGIGASLICAIACGSALAMPASSSILPVPSNTTPADREPICFVDQTLDNGSPIIVCFHPDGSHRLGVIGYTVNSFGPTTPGKLDVHLVNSLASMSRWGIYETEREEIFVDRYDE